MKSVEKIFAKIDARIRKKMENAMSDALKILKESVDEKTPEDTNTLLQNNTIDEGEWHGSTLVGRVKNPTEYAKYVEYGHTGKVFNYYKNKGRKRGGTPFYQGVGARMFERTKNEKMKEVLQKFKNIL